MFERFTGPARHVVVLAQEQAREYGHNHIGTEHLLLAVLRLPEDESATRPALVGLGITADAVEGYVLDAVPRGSGPVSGGHIPFTPRAKKVLELSLRESLRVTSSSIGPEHIVLGLLREGAGVAAQAMVRDGRSSDQIRAAVLAAAPTTGPAPGGRTPAAEEVLATAQRLAGGAPVGSHHLLEALATADTSMAGRALAQLGVTTDAVTVQLDGLDVTDTTDSTPEQAAAASMRWTVEGDTATLTSSDEDLVANLAALIEQVEGTGLGGDGPLAGTFVELHRSLKAAVASLDAALNPVEEAGPARSLRERLRRRRKG